MFRPTRRCAAFALPLLLAALPASAHNGAAAIAVPLEGITIDGDLSDWPAGLRRYPIRSALSADWPSGDDDLRAWFRVGYSAAENALYLAVEAQDESVLIDTAGAADWTAQDGVEVYLADVHGKKAGSIGQFSVRGKTPGAWGKAQARQADARVVAATGPRTYWSEWRIAMPERLAPGLIIGFDVVVCDKDDDGSFSWVAWGPRGHNKHSSIEAVGDLVIGGSEGTVGRLEGQVHWQGGRAGVPHALVQIDRPGELSEAQIVRVDADETGYWAVDLPSGRYRVGLSWPEARRREARRAVVRPGGTARVDVEVPVPVGTRVPAGSGKGHWQALGVTDGLGNRVVTSLLQDRQGDLWVGTNGGGVSRYDGRRLATWTARDGLGANQVSSLLEDRQGGLWVGTNGGGVCRYDGRQFRTWTVPDGLGGDVVLSLVDDRGGGLWIATSGGLSRFDGTSFSAFEAEGALPAGIWVLAMLVDRHENLWFAGGGAGLFRYDGHQVRSYTAAEGLPGVRSVLSLAEDRAGTLWIGTLDGLIQYDGHRFATLTMDDGLSGNRVSAILEDGGGRLWLGTDGGLSQYDGTSFQNYTTDDGLSGNEVYALLEDREGSLWLGTAEGLDRYSGDEFRTYTSQDGLGHDRVYSILEDSQGALWFRTGPGRVVVVWWPLEGGGVSRYEGKAFVNYTSADGLGEELSRGMVEDGLGNLWFGSTRYDGERFTTFTTAEGLMVPPRGLLVDQRGDLWATQEQAGVRRYEQGSFVPAAGIDSLGGRAAGPLLEDKHGHLWVGTQRGVLRYDGHQTAVITAADGLAGDEVICLFEDRQGSLWLGTDQGVSRYDGRGFRSWSRGDGLAANRVNAIAQDRDGHLLFGTQGGGVSLFDGEVFQTLTTQDGLAHNVVYDLHQDRQGDVWIATEGGLTRYRPRRVPPPVQVTHVIADRDYGAVAVSRLPASQDYLVVEFEGRSFRTRPGQMAYVYRLQGLEENWQATREERVAYADLPVGEYLFQVKAVDRDLTFSEVPAEVRIAVLPAYGQLALGGGLGLALIGLAIAGRYGLRRRRERDQARSELVRERRRHIDVQPHDIEHWTVEDFAGAGTSLQGVLNQVRALQQVDDRVLVTGEAGTGKELVARAIHAGSSRRPAPFVPVRCAGLPKQVESLAERTQVLSLLFGHSKSAFPGADADQRGLVQQARGGILFFDEVGLLPLPLQAHLLRVLTTGEVRRAGAAEGERLDLRVMAATSEDLELQIQVGTFHRSLYEYLAAHQIAVPPLRERVEAIAPLAQQIAGQVADRLGQPAPVLGPEVLAALQAYPFPGNVRELRHVLEQALASAAGRRLVPGDLRLG